MSKRDRASIWMPLYVGDWDNDTRHLTPEQDGCYGRLVRSYWHKGTPPSDNDASLAQIVGLPLAKWLRVRPVIAPFFKIQDGCWFHGRVEEELEKANRLVEAKRLNGLKGGRPRKQTETEEKPTGYVSPNLDETPARVIVEVSEITHLPSQEVGTDSQVSSEGNVVSLLAGRATRA